MQHLDDIAALVKTLSQSSTFHALVVESPPGWAKSTTIDKVLGELGLSYSSLGSYSTPLYLYNALASATGEILVLDDCAGIFGDPTAMAILKAATWSSTGSKGNRQVSWGSTSERVATKSFVFSGKLILLTNSLHRDRHTESFLSRTLCYEITFGIDKLVEMLRQAAGSSEFFSNNNLAVEVSEYLISRLQRCDYQKVNLRTLLMAYEVAQANPDTWRNLLPGLLPRVSFSEIVASLAEGCNPVEDQAREFMRQTGMTRRSFFNYRQRLGLRHEATIQAEFQAEKKVQVSLVGQPL